MVAHKVARLPSMSRQPLGAVDRCRAVIGLPSTSERAQSHGFNRSLRDFEN
jgi:hypothetical protein